MSSTQNTCPAGCLTLGSQPAASLLDPGFPAASLLDPGTVIQISFRKKYHFFFVNFFPEIFPEKSGKKMRSLKVQVVRVVLLLLFSEKIKTRKFFGDFLKKGPKRHFFVIFESKVTKNGFLNSNLSF